MRPLLILISSTCLSAGSCVPEVSSEGPLFCDVAEAPRFFTEKELEVRRRIGPENLAKDFRDNLTWERECSS